MNIKVAMELNKISNRCANERLIYTNNEDIVSPRYPNIIDLSSELVTYGFQDRLMVSSGFIILACRE